jgi:glycosyltransferase involved in cell wall biosynthesis
MTKIVLVVPAYNEEKILNASIRKLHGYMTQNIKHDWKIVIANNGSTDRTKEIAEGIAKDISNIEVMNLGEKGKGRALKYAWTNSKADIYACCDADLATDVGNLKKLFESVASGNDLVIGSRYMEGSDSQRTIGRKLTSLAYVSLVRLFFRTKIDDFQCGFKAMNDKIVREIVPQVKDNEWFFDTELILLAERAKKYKIKELPIVWREKRVKDSRVKISKAGINCIKGLIRLRFNL